MTATADVSAKPKILTTGVGKIAATYGWVQGIQTWGTFSTVWYKIVPHNLSNNEPIASIDTAIIVLM
jgi:hypothetical protein